MEVQGGTWIKGSGHVGGAGYQRDCDKANRAVALGWRLLRFTGADVEDGTALRLIEALLTRGSG